METLALHEKAVSLAKSYKQSESGLLDVLIRMREKNAFFDLKYPSLFSYCMLGLGLSDAQACYFSQVAKKSVEVPELRQAISEGTLSLSQARRVVPVITKENSQVWIDRAALLPQKELERRVAEVNPKTVKEKLKPVAPERSELKVGLSELAKNKLKRCQEIASKSKGRYASLEVTLEEMMAVYLCHKDPVERAKRSIARSHQSATERGDSKKLAPDFTVVEKYVAGKKAPAKINASVRHQVNQRDLGLCQAKLPNGQTCGSATWTHLHHVKPKSLGGPNTLQNLITLCESHHRLTHSDPKQDKSASSER